MRQRRRFSWLALGFVLTTTTSGDDRPFRLPHREQVAPGVYAAGFSDRFKDANCGWVALEHETLLIDLPRGLPLTEYLALVATTTTKPPRTLALTNVQDGDGPIVQGLVAAGVARVFASPAARIRLLEAVGESSLRAVGDRTAIGDATVPVDFLTFDRGPAPAGAAVWIASRGVLFAGPMVVHGPRAPLTRSHTAQWLATLRQLQALAPTKVVPGFGSWGGPERVDRQRRFLNEIRRQVGYHICQGRSAASLVEQVHMPVDCITWTPYGNPIQEDLEHVYRELTVPIAPFGNGVPAPADSRPRALVLIGDEPHEPGHVEEGLQPVFEAAGVVPHFAVDVRALTAQNLAKVRLLVILRDGLMRSERPGRKPVGWITPEQEHAVVSFVENGGGFLNLHNAMGEYPADGPYLNLVGGRYVGHGPLERFGVEVVDPAHPVTRGVTSFFVADEQHTPPCDEGKVHVLLRNRSDDGKTAAAGWVREIGRGRLCHLANGHTLEALLHPMYQKLLRNAILWCLGQQGP
jgi:type 1 glutamine amidotransferase